MENSKNLSTEIENSKDLLNEIENDLELSEINGGGILGSILGSILGGCSWGNMFKPGSGHNTTVGSVPR